MPRPAKGLYTPRIVDLTFAVMGLGSAVMLVQTGSLARTTPAIAAHPYQGLILLGCVAFIALSACAYHFIDRRGWDDYMGQVVTQSAMIAMVTIILSGIVIDFLLTPAAGITLPRLSVQGLIPIACFAWAIGYGFLRWKGTGA